MACSSLKGGPERLALRIGQAASGCDLNQTHFARLTSRHRFLVAFRSHPDAEKTHHLRNLLGERPPLMPRS